jgi:hypothetical protein
LDVLDVYNRPLSSSHPAPIKKMDSNWKKPMAEAQGLSGAELGKSSS